MATLRGESDGKGMSPSGFSRFRRFWIDDSGRQLPHSIVEPTIEARRRAFQYLGLVEVIDKGSLLIVRWNVSHVAPEAITRAAFLIAKCSRDTSVTLEFFWGAWALEKGYNPADAIGRMAATARYAGVEPFRGTKIVNRDAVFVRDEGALVRKTYEFWDMSKSGRNAEWRRNGLMSIAPYSLEFSLDRRDDILFSKVGAASSAADIFGAEWAETAVGRRCTRSQPDFEYDEQVCRVYQDILETGDIRVDHIRAFIRRPDNDPVWVAYSRLLLRERDEYGAPKLLAISQLRHDVEIPFLAA